MQDYLEPRIKKCHECGTEFDASDRNRGRGKHFYCSHKCRRRADNRKHYLRRNPKRTDGERTKCCVICQTQFVAPVHHPNALTCSQRCSAARINALRRRETIEKAEAERRQCQECGNIFTPNRLALGTAKYCSKECAEKVRVRQAREAARRQVYDSRFTKAVWKKAKLAVLERDGHKCVVCGYDKHPHVHHVSHLNDDDRLNDDPSNLITLCTSCHNRFHRINLGLRDGYWIVSGLVFDYFGINEVTVAGQDEKAAEVHGDVLDPEGSEEGTRQVSTGEGGERVQTYG